MMENEAAFLFLFSSFSVEVYMYQITTKDCFVITVKAASIREAVEKIEAEGYKVVCVVVL
jgi:hypothetical protein